jgi:hypothetical protein
MWKHGEVFITAIDTIPGDAIRRPGYVLVEGEATGHSHRIDRAGAAERLERGEALYLRVLAESASVFHRENRPISLPRGLYCVRKQGAYSRGGVPSVDEGNRDKRPMMKRVPGRLRSAVAVSIGS